MDEKGRIYKRDSNGQIIVDLNMSHMILLNQSREYIETALKQGYDINKNNLNGNRFLDYNFSFNKTKLALEYGANPNLVNKDGRTSFHTIVKSWTIRPKLLKLHLDHGADMRISVDNHDVISYIEYRIEKVIKDEMTCQCVGCYKCYKCLSIKRFTKKLHMLKDHRNKTFSLFEMMIDKVNLNTNKKQRIQ